MNNEYIAVLSIFPSSEFGEEKSVKKKGKSFHIIYWIVRIKYTQLFTCTLRRS